MENVPAYISIILMLTTLLTVMMFYKATNRSHIFLWITSGWLILQSTVSLSGFYTVTYSLPPRFALLIVPPLLLIAILFMIPAGRRYIDNFDLRTLTLLHVIRIPVELTLYGLFVNKVIPELMTFEGRNFDILSGISAPIVGYFAFFKRRKHRTLLLAWNVICLGLLINIVTHAILSAPSQFQKFAFDQPNIAIMYFPFVWLPCVIVPLVLLSHLASIRQLLVASSKPLVNETPVAGQASMSDKLVI